MSPASLVLLASVVLGADNHRADNAVYAKLLEPGLTITEGRQAALPAPTVPDGASPDEQRAALETLAEGRYSVAQLTRSSVVAPHILQVREEALGEGPDRLWHVDFWAVAYGKLDTVGDEHFLDQLRGVAEEDVAEGAELEQADESHEAPSAALEALGIAQPDDEREGYGRAGIDVLKRVRLNLIVHAAWTRSDESVVAAYLVDPRFTGDGQWSNRWWPLTRESGGAVSLGEPAGYSGLGGYLKVTQLAEPQGALLLEGHWIYREPHGWFEGANLLVSKLPLVVQNQVRTARRELLLAK